MTQDTRETFNTRRGTHSIGPQAGAGPDSVDPARYGQRNTDDRISWTENTRAQTTT